MPSSFVQVSASTQPVPESSPPAQSAAGQPAVAAPPTTSRPVTVARPAQNCEAAWRQSYWVADVCFYLYTDGVNVYGYLWIKCHTGTRPQINCDAIRIREVELFANDIKRAWWPGDTFVQGELKTGEVSYKCTAGTSYFLKGWEVQVQGPDGNWTPTKTVKWAADYRCLV
jgi:hypothetical protein